MRPTHSHAVFLALLVLSQRLGAQEVRYAPDSSQALSRRWDWAMQQTGQPQLRNGYWIGYSIRHLMDENSTIGSVYIKDDRVYRGPGKSLSELIYGLPTPKELTSSPTPRKLMKEVGIFFRYEPRDRDLTKVELSTFSLSVDFKGLPVLWLGRSSDAQSLDLLEGLYRQPSSNRVKEEVIAAVSMHDDAARRRGFLAEILASNEVNSVRKQAAFWLGQNDDPEAVRILKQTARQDRSTEVRKQAVFAMSQMESTEAEDALIELSKHDPSRETRKEAIFWLAQVASKRSIASLQAVLDDDTDAEVQKQAVFALSQLPRDEGIPILINLAEHHRNRVVRKEAIFWLGQSEDPRAVASLVKLVQEQ